MSKVVYIFALGHSGSTLLDLLLSGHPGICGLGEVCMMTDPTHRKRRLAEPRSKMCTCGRSVSDCELWSPVVAAIEKDPETDHLSAMRHVIASAGVAARDQWLSDSSKNVSGLGVLQTLAETGEVSALRVIHLVRDVRSFAASHLSRSGKQGTLHAMRATRFWKNSLNSSLKALQQADCPTLNVGYEELCMFPRAALHSICRFLDLPFSEDMLSPCPGGAHIATGNPMRLDPNKTSEVFYDHRWFFRRDINTAYALYPGIQRMNEKWSYPLTGGSVHESTFRPPVIDQA